MPLVLLHPVGLDGRSFQFLEPSVLDRAIAYDLPWHGDRPEPAETLTLELMADDVVAHVDGPLDLVGVSMGAAVAQYIAFRHPARVRSLLIAASTAGDGSPQRLSAQQERADQTLQLGMEGMVPWCLDRWFTQQEREDPNSACIAYVRDRLLRDDPRMFASGWLALGHGDAVAHLPGVTAPTTVLHPDQDVSPLSAKAQMVDLMPCARLQVVEGPHMVHLEQPRRFSVALRDHLAWAEGEAR